MEKEEGGRRRAFFRNGVSFFLLYSLPIYPPPLLVSLFKYLLLFPPSSFPFFPFSLPSFFHLFIPSISFLLSFTQSFYRIIFFLFLNYHNYTFSLNPRISYLCSSLFYFIFPVIHMFTLFSILHFTVNFLKIIILKLKLFILGQWYARTCDLPPVLTSEMAISCYKTIHRMNIIKFGEGKLMGKNT